MNSEYQSISIFPQNNTALPSVQPLSQTSHQSHRSLSQTSHQSIVSSEEMDSEEESQQAELLQSCDGSYDEDMDTDADDYCYDYEDEDEDHFIDEDLVTNKHKYESQDKVVLTEASTLIPIMHSRAKSITEILNIPAEAALPALRKHNWNTQRLMEAFVRNKEEFAKDAGVYHRCIQQGRDDQTSSCVKTDNVNGKWTCDICFDDELSKDEMHAMPCGHAFCLACWSGHIKAKLDDGPSCIKSTCPNVKCQELITEEEVKKLTPQLLQNFVSYQLRDFVEGKPTSRWCPGAGCKYVATLPNTDILSDNGMEVFCRGCSTSFCLGCGNEPHEPITCKDIMIWKENYNNEGSESWILQNTKACPKCRVRIEKNQGCNHMTCRQCRHEFCWICNGDWSSHSQCNRFDSSSAQGSERELARNLHYFKRFHIHADAQVFAEREMEKAEEKLSNSRFSTELGETLAMLENIKESLLEAHKQLVQCRRILKNTYIFSFHHLHKNDSNNEENISPEQFEYHQEMLERFTEELSYLIEKPMKDMQKLELVNKTGAVKKFSDRIVKYVIEEMY